MTSLCFHCGETWGRHSAVSRLCPARVTHYAPKGLGRPLVPPSSERFESGPALGNSDGGMPVKGRNQNSGGK